MQLPPANWIAPPVAETATSSLDLKRAFFHNALTRLEGVLSGNACFRQSFAFHSQRRYL
jgi:hypothetical protein